jgi:transposase
LLCFGVPLRHGTTLRPPRSAMDDHRTIASQPYSSSRWEGTTTSKESRGAQRHSLGSSYRGTLARSTGSVSLLPNVPPTLPRMGSLRGVTHHPRSVGPRLGDAGQVQARRMLHRRDLCGGEKRGSGVGKTKRGKGTKLMAVADGAGLPIAVHAASASPHEVTLVEETIARRHTRATPRRIIGDLAYDSDTLDRRLARRHIELIAPHRINRIRPTTQDGQPLRRYRRRWKIERLFAWLHNYHRILTRHEYYLANYLAFAQLACILILLKNGF